MDRTEAVALCREIARAGKGFNLYSINLTEATADDPEVVGYKIEFEVTPWVGAINAAKPMIRQKGLALKIKNDKVLIYQRKNDARPKKV